MSEFAVFTIDWRNGVPSYDILEGGKRSQRCTSAYAGWSGFVMGGYCYTRLGFICKDSDGSRASFIIFQKGDKV